MTPRATVCANRWRPYLRSLWDSGLRISQSVHTPEECAQFDGQNVELYISLLDRRFLAGDAALYARLAGLKPRSDLMSHLARLTRDRHGKFQNTIYHLEPNIKDGPGGLRDYQTLRWGTPTRRSRLRPTELLRGARLAFRNSLADAPDLRP